MDKKKRTFMMLEVDEDFKNELRQEAKALGLKLSAYVRYLLIKRKDNK